MAIITAIELDGDSCAIARTNVRGPEITVSAAELLTPTSFPGTDAFVAALRKTRRTLRLPRRTRVVLWGLPEGATPKDPGAASALAPLTAAGFKVERVVTPCNALAALSRLKSARGEDATCWVAINTGSVAIVVIRPGQLLYARAFGWNSTVGSSGSQARLLQRYSLVAFLSPEVKRAFAAAQAGGHPVRAVVTCGNLPDLRSMTMPLIEELDVEVETLDSFDGLEVNPPPTERLIEIAAAIRLACAGAVARRTRPWDDSKRIAAHRMAALTRIAAVLAIVAALAGGYVGFERWRTARRTTTTPSVRTPPPAARAPNRAASPSTNKTAAPLPGRATPPAPNKTGAPAPNTAAGAAPAPVAAPNTTAAPPSNTPAPRASESKARPVPVPQSAPVTAAAPLPDPLPRVIAILISNERRFATIDRGVVVGIGDTIGRRVVVGIDERAVILREPSGIRVRVALGGRARAPKPTGWARSRSM